MLKELVRKLFALISEKLKAQSALKHGVKVILYDRLWQAHRYYVKQGWIDLPDYRNVEYMHGAYKGLGGNGAADRMMEEFKNLPSNPPDEG